MFGGHLGVSAVVRTNCRIWPAEYLTTPKGATAPTLLLVTDRFCGLTRRPTERRTSCAARNDIISRMKSLNSRVPISLILVLACIPWMAKPAGAQATTASADSQSLVKQGQKLNSEGKQDE